METLSLDISSLNEKDDQQMITLINASDLDGNELVDNPIPLVHHVLEPTDFSKDTEKFYQNAHCLICNAKFGVSGRGAVHIFSNEVKTSCRHMDLAIVLSSIVQRELDSSALHSSAICKKCFKVLDDIDSIEGQLVNMKQEVANKFFRTQALLQHEKNGLSSLFKDGVLINESNHEKEFKITSRVRGKRNKRGRGKRQHRSSTYVKLEVKEESEEVLNFVNFVDISENDHLEKFVHDRFSEMRGLEKEEGGRDDDMKIDIENVFEVDGLDLNNEDNTIQIGGTLLPTANNEIANKEALADTFSDKVGKYKCRYCQTVMHSFSDIQNHLIQFHAERLFECEVCEERFGNQSQLLEHLEQHLLSGEKSYSCNLCTRRFALPRQLKEHLRHHMNKTIPCYQCPKRFKSENALQEHMNTHTGFRPYACEQCHKRFTSKHILRTHMRTHGSRNRPHKCKVCQKHFLTAHHLSDHMQIHQNRKDFVCESCGKAFGTQRSLDLHSITHSGVKNFVCRICFKAFARKGEVEDHERIHTGEKPFQCEICGATFSQRSNLQSHKRATHLEEKKYQCAECNKAFKRRRLLVYHIMSVHTGERPYKCSYCSSAFVYPEHYKKHLRIHTGEKPFKCEICGKAFNSRDNKNAHKFIHSDKKQYECALCGNGFMRKPQLLVHIQQHDRTENLESYIKVNSSNVVDAELIESGAITSPALGLKIDEEQSIEANLDQISLPVVRNATEVETAVDISRQIQISDSEDVQRYIIHKAGEKSSEESMEHFLASFRGQVVEVRAEDLERYTELSTDQITMPHVAAQVVVGGNAGPSLPQETTTDFRLFQIQLEDDKEVSSSDSQRTDTVIATDAPLVVSRSKEASTTLLNKHLLVNTNFKKCVPNGSNVRHTRNWSQTSDRFSGES